MFYKLLEQSVVIRGLLALCVIGAVIYQVIMGQDISPELSNIAMVIIGFFFGGLSEKQAQVYKVKRYGDSNRRG